MQKIIIALCVLALASCGDSGKQGKTGSSLKNAVGGSKSALTAKKPMDAMKAMTTPKPLPGAMSSGTAMFTVADPTAGDTDGGDERWTVSESDEIDLDGDSDADQADVLLDDEAGDLYVWWNGEEDLDGDGNDDAYTALAIIFSDGSVAFLLEVINGGVLACEADASGNAGCIVCDTEGLCDEIGADADYDDEDSFEEEDELFDEEEGEI